MLPGVIATEQGVCCLQRKRARQRRIQGQAEAQVVAVLMPRNGSPGNVNPAGVLF